MLYVNIRVPSPGRTDFSQERLFSQLNKRKRTVEAGELRPWKLKNPFLRMFNREEISGKDKSGLGYQEQGEKVETTPKIKTNQIKGNKY